jgi:hypothetical protein
MVDFVRLNAPSSALSVYLSDDGIYSITPVVVGKMLPLAGWRVINNITGEISPIFSSVSEARRWASNVKRESTA